MCIANRSRIISGKGMTIGQAGEHERAFLSPLSEENFPIHEVLYPLIVDGKGCVKVKTNWYSTPLWPGLRTTALVWPLSIEIRYDGEGVAQHPRCYGRGHQILNLEHYLDVPEKNDSAWGTRDTVLLRGKEEPLIRVRAGELLPEKLA